MCAPLEGLLGPIYSWGSRCLKSWGSAAWHCEATSVWLALLPTAEQELAEPDSPHHRLALGLPLHHLMEPIRTVVMALEGKMLLRLRTEITVESHSASGAQQG